MGGGRGNKGKTPPVHQQGNQSGVKTRNRADNKVEVPDDQIEVDVHMEAEEDGVTRGEFVQFMNDERKAREDFQRLLLEAIGNLSPSTSTPKKNKKATSSATEEASSTEAHRPADRGRRINISGLEKLEADVTLRDFTTWRQKWEDFSRLERIQSYQPDEQRSALRMVLSSSMLQVLEMVIGIDPDDEYSMEHILNEISSYIRKKRSVALDRVEFEECRQENYETFDEFYIRLQRIAKCADLCEECWDQRLTTRVMTGISDQETKKKLLACKEFPKLEDAVILCRGDEAASNNAPMLSNKQKSFDSSE